MVRKFPHPGTSSVLRCLCSGALLAALLTACGGGGGGGGSSTTTNPGTSAASSSTASTATGNAISTACSSGAAAASSTSAWTIEAGSTCAFTEISLANDDTVNPMRGYHRWYKLELVPQPSPAQVAYVRYLWNTIETSQGVYDFSNILKDANAAKAAGKKFAFRIMPMMGYGDNNIYVPGDIYQNAACAHNCGFWSPSDTAASRTFVPDWNDPWFLSREKAVLTAVRDQLTAAGITLAWVDVGMYGQYGEWYIDPTVYNAAPAGITLATDATKQAIGQMHADLFPNDQLLVVALQPEKTFLTWAMNQTTTRKPVGLRNDCLGRDWALSKWDKNPADFTLIQDRWKIAPFVGELCSPDADKYIIDTSLARTQVAHFHMTTVANGNFASAIKDTTKRWAAITEAQQSDMLMMGHEAGYRYVVSNSSVSLNTDGSLHIKATIRNAGNAPTYDDWTLTLQLLDSSGNVVATTPVSLDLKASVGAGSTQSIEQNWSPAAPVASRYSIRLTATNSFWPILKWATAERNSDGSVTIATVYRNH